MGGFGTLEYTVLPKMEIHSNKCFFSGAVYRDRRCIVKATVGTEVQHC